MSSAIYMITMGDALNRKVVICSDEYCYPLFRGKNKLVSDWVGALYAEDAKKLVKAYKSLSASPFGRMYNEMLKKNRGEGGCTTTSLTPYGVKELLEESKLGLDAYADRIYEALMGTGRDMVRLDKPEKKKEEKIYMKLTEEQIYSNENEDYSMSKEDFVKKVLQPEFDKYIDKLLAYAKRHSFAECSLMTGKWWDSYKISESTERALDEYLKAHYPGKVIPQAKEENSMKFEVEIGLNGLREVFEIADIDIKNIELKVLDGERGFSFELSGRDATNFEHAIRNTDVKYSITA